MGEQTAQKRRGQVIVLGPILIVVLGGILSITADVGHLFVERSRLQNAADSGSLAAARVLIAARAEAQVEEDAREAASEEADAIAELNAEGAALQVEYGTIDEDGNFQTAGEGSEATAVRATASRNEAAPAGAVRFSFAPILGLNACEVINAATASSTASIGGLRGGLSPFAVHRDELVPPGQTMTFYPGSGEEDPGLGGEQHAPGNWGLLNLDGGSLGTPELRDWILNGYDGEVIIGEDGYLWLDGTTGFRATLESEMEQRIGDDLVMVVFDQVTGTGQNANYRCIGFLIASLVDVDLHGQNQYATCQVGELTSVHDVLVGGDYESPNMRKLQLVQ